MQYYTALQHIASHVICSFHVTYVGKLLCKRMIHAQELHDNSVNQLQELIRACPSR